MINLIIFASGSGSNALKIIEYFQNHDSIRVVSVFTNNPNAGVINHAKNYGIAYEVFDKKQFNSADFLKNHLQKYKPDYLILAGFLLLVPDFIIHNYENKIINIHPSLLPKYGGRGMYGHFIHEAVHAAKEQESGLTIHLVNKEYDKGEILFQAKYLIKEEDTPETIGRNILALEHKFYSQIIEQYIKTNSNIF